MSVIDLPCDYEEWFEYKKLFILLSHLRSLGDLNVFISSHTRADLAPSAIADVLVRLKGLVAYLSNECSPEEQKRFFTRTLPFIAREAAFLEERIPERGLPYLEKQENSALVLGRKVVLSIICNAFLCTFPPVSPGGDGGGPFTFEKFFNYCLDDKNDGEKKIQVAKLRCILCYFERAASGKCNLSGVITYRRQVQCKIELPKLSEWERNTIPLCPFAVDDNNLIEDSGGHTLQVIAVSETLGGGVLDKDHGQENIRFSICPELLIAQLVMSSMDDNEAMVVTGTERFADYSGFASSFKFVGEFKDESERDVFGNLLNSLVAMDTQIIPSDKQETQYQPDSILRELNKAYAGFYCQQDRGDINTELIALTARRQSLAFVAEDYPEFCAPFVHQQHRGGGGAVSRQMDIGNIHINSNVKVSVPPISIDSSPMQPLSPIPEISDSPNFSSMLASSILKSSLEHVLDKYASSPARISGTGKSTKVEDGVEGLAAKIACSILNGDSTKNDNNDNNSADESFYTPEASSPVDDLAYTLATSILAGSLVKEIPPDPRPTRVSVAMREEELVSKSTTMARSIISDVLSLSKDTAVPPPPPPITIVTKGKPSNSSREMVTMATQLSDNILCDVIRTAEATPLSHPPLPQTSSVRPAIFIQEEKKKGTGNQSSGVTDHDAATTLLHKYTDRMTEVAIKEGLSTATNGEYSMSRGTPEEDGAVRKTDEEIKLEAQSSFKKKQPFPFVRPGHLSSVVAGGGGSYKLGHPPALPTPTEYGSDLDTPIAVNSRLLTPLSSRAGYAWSIASTRDEDSRPVSPTDLNHIALGLSKNSDEFSSLFSKIVISHAITNITGETVSPQAITSEEGGEGGRGRDLTSLPGSSKIGIFLSTLGEAEPPSDVGGASAYERGVSSNVDGASYDEGGASSYDTSWHRMRSQLLRPIATGNWGRGLSGADPQMKAMIQWMAASASGRPRLFYYTSKEERVKKLSQVTSHMVAMHWTVGQLCQAIVAFGKRTQEKPQKDDLFTSLLQIK